MRGESILKEQNYLPPGPDRFSKPDGKVIPSRFLTKSANRYQISRLEILNHYRLTLLENKPPKVPLIHQKLFDVVKQIQKQISDSVGQGVYPTEESKTLFHLMFESSK